MSAIRKSVSAKSKVVKKPAIKTSVTKYPRHDRNPFRAGSSYGACFDILATPEFLTNGIHKHKLAELLAELTHKKLRNAKYDTAVVCSASESLTGRRHRSCKSGFWVRRNNDHVQLMLDRSCDE